MAPKLSVIVPTYQRVESLLSLIKGIGRQTLRDIELIIVDQNPEGFLAGALPPEDLARATFIHLTEPNASKARNFGFAHSTGEYLLFIDDDLQPEEQFCERALSVFVRHPQVNCLCPIIYSGTNEDDCTPSLARVCTGVTIANSDLCEITESITAAVFFKRDYFLRSGGFDELLFSYARTAEDQEFFLRMGKRGLQIWLDPTLRVFHDEGVPGGCGLRTDPYWKSRERCVKSWVFRYRTHGSKNGRLSYRDVWYLVRSSFLNRGTLKSGARNVWHEAELLVRSAKDCRQYLEPHLSRYRSVREINYLEQYGVCPKQP